MSILGAVRHYTKRLERRFGKRKKVRRQFNTTLDRRLVLRIMILGQALMIPLYPLVEHLLQLGLAEVSTLIEDRAFREDLQRHLLESHLLVNELQPMSEPVSRRVHRLKNALRLLQVLETMSPEEQKETLLRLVEEPTESAE